MKQKTNKHKMNLVLGDWSRDGHGQSETFGIETNLTKNEIQESYKKGVEIVDLDLSEKVCRYHEDDSISLENLEKLKKHGLKFFQENGEEYELEENFDETGFSVSEEDFVIMFMFIVKLGNPLLEWNFCESESINIGGYGLFH